MSCTRKTLIGVCGICDEPEDECENLAWIPITSTTVIPDGWYWISEKLWDESGYVDLYYISRNRWFENDFDPDGEGTAISEAMVAYMPINKPEPFKE